MEGRSIIVVGGGTSGWLTAAYLARAFEGRVSITLLESPGIGIIGVGEGAFPTIRETLRYIGIDEARFVRQAGATFKQGVRFDDWLHAPAGKRRHRYLHPFEPPFHGGEASLVPYWLLKDADNRPPFAEAMTIQNRVAEAARGPKRPGEGEYDGPLAYAYHFDAHRLADLLRTRAIELGVRHLEGVLTGVEPDGAGGIARIHSDAHGALAADLFVDCSGFRAELIGRTLGASFRSAKAHLFTDRALACKIPYDHPDAPIESVTTATAHEGGWIWDIGLQGARGLGCVFSSAHVSDGRAAEILRGYVGHDRFNARIIPFEPGYRETQWVGNCVAVGLSGGFLEPLESTGIVLIEAAAAMIAELFPFGGPIDAPAARFNTLMTARYAAITNFLKLHYCLSRRDEPFWRDNVAAASIPDALATLLAQWRHRPPSRFDFTVDVESFAWFNYQYVLYGMEFETDLSGARDRFGDAERAERWFERIRGFGRQAVADLPEHRALVRQLEGGVSA
ncbi:tryptophan halogenase family protein [Sphingomonas sp. Y38-1Y]|uniref:tryptophan halogenase family protein n=1 Tax=Sphingomonas sp. Y38-1Y TaxID=3078265 RepID=UPI0028E4D4D4|nr:tryptophan halogenase family protein [Sphingomonas sp. Y38-1Y]